jgi:pyruvate/2-oxoglutarate dehydrogenase complex dihydrolipoamide dehydrogenase (E3) component
MLKDGAGNVAEKLLENQNVKILKGSKVGKAVRDKLSGKWAITLANGDDIFGDVFISTVGVVPNSGFIPPRFLSNYGWFRSTFSSKSRTPQ